MMVQDVVVIKFRFKEAPMNHSEQKGTLGEKIVIFSVHDEVFLMRSEKSSIKNCVCCWALEPRLGAENDDEDGGNGNENDDDDDDLMMNMTMMMMMMVVTMMVTMMVMMKGKQITPKIKV